MVTAEQRIADLEQRVADLTAQVAELKAQAFVIRTFEEIIAGRVGYGPGHRAAPGHSRPRHLSAVEGGRQ